MKSPKFLLITGAFALLASSATYAASQPKHEASCDETFSPPHMGKNTAMQHIPIAGNGPLPPFLHGMELSDTQQDKIFSILHAQTPLIREQEKIIRKTHESLEALVKSDRFDDAKAKAIAEGGARAMAEIALLHIRSDYQIYAILTPEQRKQAGDMKAKFHLPMPPMSKSTPAADSRKRFT